MERTMLLLGSNEGDRAGFLQKAREQLVHSVGKLTAASSVYQTAAWGKTDQADFLNQVVTVETELTPSALLTAVLSIESKLGRRRTEKWATRTLDIDILFYGDQVIHRPDLIIPHPAIAQRRFTLVPLVEIAPDFLHPVLKKTMEELLEECEDDLEVWRVGDVSNS